MALFIPHAVYYNTSPKRILFSSVMKLQKVSSDSFWISILKPGSLSQFLRFHKQLFFHNKVQIKQHHNEKRKTKTKFKLPLFVNTLNMFNQF